ncbi:MAG: hypothetical protein VW239_08800, partial [Candidatus Nanopelagicales bacterium]
MLDRGATRDVQGEGRLAHRRPRRSDDQLAGVQTVCQLIKICESSRDTHHLATAVGDGLDLGQRAVHEIAQREVVLGGSAFGDLVDLGLRTIDDVIYFA